MSIDWHQLLIPTVSLIELFIRGTSMYLALFFVLRILVRRNVGAMGLTDVLLLVLIADAAQNAMAAEYHSLTEGIVLCGTIILWSYFLNVLAYRYEWFRKLLEPPPLPVIQDGRIQRRNLRQELVTEDELYSLLRQQGIDDIQVVRIAHIEPDGQLSVIQQQPSSSQPPPHKKHHAGLA